MKEKYLKPFTKESVFCPHCRAADALSFLKSLSDEQIKMIGNSLYWLYPKYPVDYISKFANNRTSEVDYSFADEFRKDYGLPNKYTSIDKARGARLVRMLKENPKLTAAEFIAEVISYSKGSKLVKERFSYLRHIPNIHKTDEEFKEYCILAEEKGLPKPDRNSRIRPLHEGR